MVERKKQCKQTKAERIPRNTSSMRKTHGRLRNFPMISNPKPARRGTWYGSSFVENQPTNRTKQTNQPTSEVHLGFSQIRFRTGIQYYSRDAMGSSLYVRFAKNLLSPGNNLRTTNYPLLTEKPPYPKTPPPPPPHPQNEKKQKMRSFLVSIMASQLTPTP